jgi:F-type H+-transporting ATPase subunit delta
MANRNAARRYATALFALCRDQDALGPVRADLVNLAHLLETSEEWRVFVTEPSGSKTLRARAIKDLLETHAHPLTARFIAFLDHKNRITLFPVIVEEWLIQHDAFMGVMRARVVSATPLTGNQQAELTSRLARRYGKKVVLSIDSDPSLIGGLQIFIGDQVFDFSIETQLQQLQKRLIYA